MKKSQGSGRGVGVEERAVPLGRRIKVLMVFHPVAARRHLGSPLGRVGREILPAARNWTWKE